MILDYKGFKFEFDVNPEKTIIEAHKHLVNNNIGAAMEVLSSYVTTIRYLEEAKHLLEHYDAWNVRRLRGER